MSYAGKGVKAMTQDGIELELQKVEDIFDWLAELLEGDDETDRNMAGTAGMMLEDMLNFINSSEAVQDSFQIHVSKSYKEQIESYERELH
jgi:cAMP phosphodiesterase